MKNIEPGIYPELSNEDYHGHHESYSKSSLVDFSVYPYNMIYQRQHRVRKTIFDLGTAAHTAILEPEKWEKTISVIPGSMLASNGAKSTKACKEFIKEESAKNKAVLTESERDRILRVRDSIHENPAHSKAKEFLTGGLPEVSCFWMEQFRGEEIEEETGYKYMITDQWSEPYDDSHHIMIKVRPDYLPANQIVTDLKITATPIDQEGFERQAYNLHYHWSAALTHRGLTNQTGKLHRAYVFVVIEINSPHEVAVYQSSEEFVALGKKEVMQQLQRLSWCDKYNKWPGMPNRVQQVGLPGWVYKKLNNGGC